MRCRRAGEPESRAPVACAAGPPQGLEDDLPDACLGSLRRGLAVEQIPSGVALNEGVARASVADENEAADAGDFAQGEG